MTADEFVVKLAALAPSVEDLAADRGIDEDACERVRAGYIASPRPGGTQGSKDPLLDACLRYDMSNIEIAEVMFIESPEDNGDEWVVGYEAGEPLVISRKTGQVMVKEGGSDHVFSTCAASGGQFLSAMYHMAKYIAESGADDEDEDALAEAASECGVLAGGEEYARFYENQLGVGEGDWE